MEFIIPEDIDTDGLIFLNVVGSHAQGAADQYSDVDYHGCYIEPTSSILDLNRTNDSHRLDGDKDGLLYEVQKCLALLLKSNCNFLEDIFSPIVLYEGEYFDDIYNVAIDCVTKQAFFCYRGIAEGARPRLVTEAYKTRPWKKIYRNIFRSLISGIHAMDTGDIIVNFNELKEMYNLGDYSDWETDYNKFHKELISAYKRSPLQENTNGLVAMEANDLLLRIRRDYW